MHSKAFSKMPKVQNYKINDTHRPIPKLNNIYVIVIMVYYGLLWFSSISFNFFSVTVGSIQPGRRQVAQQPATSLHHLQQFVVSVKERSTLMLLCLTTVWWNLM